MNTESLRMLEHALTYSFSNKSLLQRALTRKAYALENKICEDQEIFRTLGDAVLKAILIDLLIASGAGTRSEITMKKIDLESAEGLGKVASSLRLGEYLFLGAGEEKMNLRNRQYVLSESLEAVVGALYLDGGFESTKDVVARLFGF